MKLLEIADIVYALFPVSPNGNNITTAILTLIESVPSYSDFPVLTYRHFSVCKGVGVCVFSSMLFRHLCAFVYPRLGQDAEPHISTPQGFLY